MTRAAINGGKRRTALGSPTGPLSHSHSIQNGASPYFRTVPCDFRRENDRVASHRRVDLHALPHSTFNTFHPGFQGRGQKHPSWIFRAEDYIDRLYALRTASPGRSVRGDLRGVGRRPRVDMQGSSVHCLLAARCTPGCEYFSRRRDIKAGQPSGSPYIALRGRVKQ